jgi:isochorismate synthase
MILEEFYKRVEAHYKNQLPFVIYRKPNKNRVNGKLQGNANLIFTIDFNEKGFVFSPFDAIDKTVLIPNEISEDLSASVGSNASNETSNAAACNVNDAKKFHINLVEKGVSKIKNSALKKVVLSRQEKVTISETNPISIFKKLLNKYTTAFVYCWYHPKVGLWLGATPETLIKIESNRFSIMALAGTQDFKGNLNVVWKEKELQEQQIVTDFIIDNLKPSVEHINVSDTETVKAGNLVHLKTMISAQLKPNVALKQIIEALHPTPAVCGLPKAEAKAFIKNNENYYREFYTGFLGELNYEKIVTPRSGRRNIENRAYAITKKSTQLYVNLRCMQLKNQQAIIYVGGGITESSNPEREWEETVSKSVVIKSVL